MVRLPPPARRAILLSWLVAACAQPASPSAMAVARPSIEPAAAYRDAITVAATGGGLDTDPLSRSQVDNAAFREALVRSLRAARLGGAEGGRFRLEAFLKRLDQPTTGSNMTVTATVKYQLSEVAIGWLVYQRTLVTSGTATSLQVANERAMRANIERLVDEIAALPDRPALF